MGSTCFMNTILQTFIHNPLLRAHFLSDKHNSKMCQNSSTCLACEMDKLFQNVMNFKILLIFSFLMVKHLHMDLHPFYKPCGCRINI